MSTTNGQQPVPDPELISAYYDAETMAEEMAAVERLMADSNGPVQDLEDYEQLSLNLRELHRVHPVPDLRDAVLSAVSQAGVRPAAAARTSAESVENRRRFVQIIAGLAGLVAAVTLLVWPRLQVPPADAVAHNDGRSRSEENMPMLGESAITADAASEPHSSANGVTTMSGDAVELNVRTLNEARMAEFEADIDDTLAGIVDERPLPEVGEVVGYLDRNADELTWVAVTVVDVQKAGDQVQFLLSRHGVEAPERAPPIETAQQPDEQMTFVVEADWDQMEAVIVELSDSSLIRTVEVDAPDGAGAPPELQNYAMNREDDDRPADPESPKNSWRQRVLDRGPQLALEAPALRQMKSTASVPIVGRAVQLQANLPEVDLQRIAAKRSAEPTRSNAAPTAEEKTDAKVAATPKERMDLPGAVVARPRAKVLIILQPR